MLNRHLMYNNTYNIKQINDPHLVRLDFYPNSNEIFVDVAIADGISNVYKDKNNVEPGFSYVYHANNSTNGSHVVIGSIVIRTSSELTASDQQALTQELIDLFILL